jgi:uncharacterized protein (TIGR02217 family)
MTIPLGPHYPELIGLAFSVVRRPKGSTEVQPHVSGREVRLGYWTYPLYEWDLTYSILRDFQPCPSSLIQSELKRLQGFFLYVRGSLVNFAFRDPDDYQVTGQALSPTANGARQDFVLIRTWGDVSYGAAITEPIGFPDTAGLCGPFNVYLNGILQSPSTYDTFFTPAIGSYVHFFTPPPADATVSVDMSYWFSARFKDDTLDFEKFSGAPGAGFWAVKKLTLVSCRADSDVFINPSTGLQN